MNEYTPEELTEALRVVVSSIHNCEKIHPKFAAGTSQHSLLKNRLKALYISKSLIVGEDNLTDYAKDELLGALPPITSIISKCEKAQLKFVEGTSHYTRFERILKAMYISKSLITEEISKHG